MKEHLHTLLKNKKYSDYYNQLEDIVKARYCDKMDLIGAGVDDSYTLEANNCCDFASMTEINTVPLYIIT